MPAIQLLSTAALLIRGAAVDCLDSVPCIEIVGVDGSGASQPCCCSTSGASGVLRIEWSGVIDLDPTGQRSLDGSVCDHAYLASWRVLMLRCRPSIQDSGAAPDPAVVSAQDSLTAAEGWRVMSALTLRLPIVSPRNGWVVNDLSAVHQESCVGWSLRVDHLLQMCAPVC